MLKLTRRIGESIRIGDQIVVTIISRGKLPGEFKVGISAPESVHVRRAELVPHSMQKGDKNDERQVPEV